MQIIMRNYENRISNYLKRTAQIQSKFSLKRTISDFTNRGANVSFLSFEIVLQLLLILHFQLATLAEKQSWRESAQKTILGLKIKFRRLFIALFKKLISEPMQCYLFHHIGWCFNCYSQFSVPKWRVCYSRQNIGLKKWCKKAPGWLRNFFLFILVLKMGGTVKKSTLYNISPNLFVSTT